MENNNNRGSGVFLGIVSIATLIVAIIGATFAYFSVTATSAEDAVQLGAYEFNASIEVRTLYPTSESEETMKALIPLDASHEINDPTGILNAGLNNTNILYAINVGGSGNVGGEVGNICVDDSGFQVCALLEVTINNYGFQPITLTGQLKTISNIANPLIPNSSPFKHLAYQPLKGNIAETEGQNNSFQLDGPAVIIEQSPENNEGLTSLAGQVNKSVTIPAAVKEGTGTTPGKAITYVLIYLAEAKDEGELQDQSEEMGARYQGQLIYSTSDESNKLTGTFTLRTQNTEEEPPEEEPPEEIPES